MSVHVVIFFVYDTAFADADGDNGVDDDDGDDDDDDATIERLEAVGGVKEVMCEYIYIYMPVLRVSAASGDCGFLSRKVTSSPTSFTP